MNSRDSRTGGNILLSNFNIKSFIPSDINNMNSIKQFPLKLLLIQCILTYYFTNTKRFSIQAYIMNLAWLYGIYFTYITKNIKFLLVPIILKALFLVVNIVYGNIPKYITTDYLYSDFFEIINKNSKCIEYYTEGDYNGLIPLNTLDKDIERNIQNWGLKMYNYAYNNPRKNIFNGELMIKSQNNKYKWIVENLGITSSSKVLELGFGKIDLMKYIRDNTGATVEGTNLSLEQIKKARKIGFKCYHINHEDIGDNMDVLDRYDVIITNGTLEYLVNTSDSYSKYETFADNVYKLLTPGGKWYTTTIHMSDDFKKEGRLAYNVIKHYFKNDNTFMNFYNVYYLQAGNEGGYPIRKDGLTKYVSKDKFNVILQQDRTIDYLLSSVNWLICQINKNRKGSLSEKIKANINHLICFLVAPLYDASYICYTPSRNWKYQPWLWQFLRQPNGHRPVDHYWIIFQKK